MDFRKNLKVIWETAGYLVQWPHFLRNLIFLRFDFLFITPERLNKIKIPNVHRMWSLRTRLLKVEMDILGPSYSDSGDTGNGWRFNEFNEDFLNA